jgi:HlyD family secretion protein
MRLRVVPILLTAAFCAACQQSDQPAAPIYDTAQVEPRDIEVSVDAAGVIEPETTVEVKSKASGEILAVHAETGDVVKAGTLLVEVDQRTPKNQLDEAEAALAAARARLQIATTQRDRAQKLVESGTLTQTDLEQSELEYANAQAQVVSSQVAVENARIAMEDTQVRAPITGTIIEKAVEPGMVISSPTRDVSGGTVLIKMADLTEVQVRTLVDETDIGKIQPGMPSKVTVAAYPNQPFDGEVLKIEPMAIAEQNVTMFAVLIRLENRKGLLMPGMNADVRISIAKSEAVPSVPTAALRTNDDIPATASMLGISESQLRSMLALPEAASGASSGQTLSFGGRSIQLPPGVDADKVRTLMQKRRSGESLTADEQALLRQVFAGARTNGGGAGPPGGFEGPPPAGVNGAPPGGFEAGSGFQGRAASQPSVANYQFGGDYWVVAVRGGKAVPVKVSTGLTDLAYTQIRSGLSNGEHVLLLPSSSLYEQQAQLQKFISDRFGSNTPFQQAGPRGRPR